MTEHVSDTRRVHVVGSVPAPAATLAMQLITAQVGRFVTSMPDGETTRPNWVIELIEVRGGRPELRVVRRSRLSQPRPLRPVLDPPRYTARTRITADTLGLPYAIHAGIMWPVFQDVAPPGVRPQFGIPGPADVAMFSWAAPWRHYDLEAHTAARQVNEIHTLTAGAAVFQLEIPLETTAVCKTPPWLRARVADRFARALVGFVTMTTPGTTWIVHLCRGNKNDTELVAPRDVAGEVELANAIWAHWPAGAHPLDAFHFPFGGPSRPAPYAPDYYLPLVDLAVPDAVHLSAGVVRARGADLRQHQWALQAADVAARRRCGVSTPCGLGRQPGAVAATFEMLAKLAHT